MIANSGQEHTLGDMVNSILFELDDAVNKAQLGVEYTFESDGPNLVLKTLIQLDRSKPETATFVWKVPESSKIKSSLRVTEARVTTADGARDLTDLSGGVMDPVEIHSEITVLSDGFSIF